MSEYIVKIEEPVSPLFYERQLKEIVRCCDCKHHEYLNVSYSDKLFSVCLSEQWIGAEGDNPLVEPNGFCAWGERK